MNKGFSVYLDLVRFIAACLVYLYHSNQRRLIEDILPLSSFGHSSVIVFFVLSGYVIAYVTEKKENAWISYTTSRMSRVYSVAVPAVALTLVLDWTGRSLYPELYAGYPFDHLVVRVASSLAFANEVWFVSITSLSNVPYWSICYEVWYYVAFGLLTFLPRRAGWIVVGAISVILGPKIVLLAPIWGLGVLLHRWQWLASWAQSSSWTVLLGTYFAIWFFHYVGVQEFATGWLIAVLGSEMHKQLTFSKFFPADYLLGVLVFLNFAAMRNVAPRIERAFARIERPVRTVASYTFTLYLLHQPLFLFWAAVLRGDPRGYWNWAAITALVAASVAAIGYFTENKRYLLRAQFESALQWVLGQWKVRRGIA